jgi:demethylmenaquinone methyltransferase/2-methoxy-6-polyprenyl-1,4-benzoquinol methylase
MAEDKNRHAQGLFDGIAAGYDSLAELFSFLQYGRWRRFLVSQLGTAPDDMVLDLCTGTAGVAVAVARRFRSQVVGVDLSGEMLLRARRKVRGMGLTARVPLVVGRAESLPFREECFDAVCFTFLLRYVQDPEATLREVTRVLKPGGRLASLEFAVPDHGVARRLWLLYTRGAMPLLSWPLSPGWRRVGAFLGPSIEGFYEAHHWEQLQGIWERAGIGGVRTRRLSWGGAVVMWGRKNE